MNDASGRTQTAGNGVTSRLGQQRELRAQDLRCPIREALAITLPVVR
jgi:hypothetical protein